jgi:broad specificity phosphatase PhoE
MVVLLGLPTEAIWRFQVALGSLSIVTVHETGPTLDLWNDMGHLEDGNAG